MRDDKIKVAIWRCNENDPHLVFCVEQKLTAVLRSVIGEKLILGTVECETR